MNNPLYIIERWPDGWLICAPSGQRGIPLNALTEAGDLLAAKNTVADLGIVHHYKQRGAIFSVCTKEGSVAWRQAIEATIANLDHATRWWRGCDVGTSSAAMFAVLAPQSINQVDAAEMGKGSVPHDSADFGRCVRLLEAVPVWRTELHKVAAAYPETKWPAIIARWDELETAEPKEQTRILQNL